MRIISLTAQNFKRLRAVEISPDGNVIEICGRNAQGKSSVLDAIAGIFASAGALPKRPVHDGAEQSVLRASIGNEAVEYIVTRRITAGGTTLTVEAPSGARFPSPQAMLDKLIGAISFDPMEFAREKPHVQFEQLRQIVKLDIDADALDGQNRTDFEKRTEINRDAAKLRGQASGIHVSPELPKEPIDTAALIAEMQQAGEHNSGIVSLRAERDTEDRNIAVRADEAKRRRDQGAALHQQAAALIRQADLREEQAETIEQEVAVRLKAAGDLLALPDPIDTAALATELREAQATNSEITHRDRRDTIEAEATALEKRSTELTERMEARKKEKAEAMARAKFPVPHLSFGDGEVLLNGFPLDQASQAERIRVSVSIAIAANPKLRVLCIRDGSLMDRESWRLLGELVTSADYQCWIERTTDDDETVGIIIEDGAVKGAPALAQPEPEPEGKTRRRGTPDLLASL